MTDENELQDTYVPTDEDSQLMAQFEEDYMTLEEVKAYVASHYRSYLKESTENRSKYASEHFSHVLPQVYKNLRTITTTRLISPAKQHAVLPEVNATSYLMQAAIILNQLAPPCKKILNVPLRYKKELADVIESPEFSKRMGDFGLKMSELNKTSRKKIIEIVNRNTNGGG